MARKPLATDSVYSSVRVGLMAAMETNDCAVIAVALAAGVSYDVAHRTLSKFGRENRKPTMFYQTNAALKELNVRLQCVTDEVQDRIPARSDRSRRRLTTYTAERFPGVFREGERYLALTSGHILYIEDGKVRDWSNNRSLRIIDLWRIL